MVPRYAKEIVALVEGLAAVLEGQLPASACSDLLAAVEDRQRRSRAEAMLLRAIVRSDSHLVALCEEMLTLMHERETVLEELGEGLCRGDANSLAETGRRLQQVSYHITALAKQVQEGRRALPQDAAFPALDDAIKLGRAVLQGTESAELLHAPLAGLVSLHRVLADEGAPAEALSAYQRGVGALAHYMEEPADPQPLRLGLQILAEVGARLVDVSVGMRPTPTERSFNQDPLWEDLRQAVQGWYDGTVPRPFLLGKLEEILLVADGLRTNIERMPPLEQEGLMDAVDGPVDIFQRLKEAIEEGNRAPLAACLSELESCYDGWLWCADLVPHPVRTGSALRPLLEHCRQITQGARQRLQAWRGTCTQALRADADLARMAGDVEQDLQQMEETVTDLLCRGTEEPLIGALNTVCALLARLGEAQSILTARA